MPIKNKSEICDPLKQVGFVFGCADARSIVYVRGTRIVGCMDAGGDNKTVFMRTACQFWPVYIEIVKRQNVIWLMIIWKGFGGGWYLGTQLTIRQ